jgi:hypothetical protein
MVHTESLNIQRAERGTEGNKVFVLSPPPPPALFPPPHTHIGGPYWSNRNHSFRKKTFRSRLQLRIKQGSNESLGSGENDMGHFLCLHDSGSYFENRKWCAVRRIGMKNDVCEWSYLQRLYQVQYINGSF